MLADSNSTLSPVAKWTRRFIAMLFLCLVIVVYGRALSFGRWPPGHPWAGLFFLTAAAMSCAQSLGPHFQHRSWRDAGSVISAVLAVLGLLWAILWYMSATGWPT